MGQPDKESLRAAIQENREQARHIERGRSRLLYLNGVLAIGILSSVQGTWLSSGPIRDVLLLLIVVFSSYSFVSFSKITLDHIAHRKAAVWAAHHLNLLERPDADGDNRNIFKDSANTFLGLDLPIPGRTSIYVAFPLILTATVWGIAASYSFLLDYLYSEIFMTEFPKWGRGALKFSVILFIGFLYTKKIAEKALEITDRREPNLSGDQLTSSR